MDYPKSVPGVGLVDGKFVDEDQETGTPGSLIPADWGNSVTEEMLNVLREVGDEPDESQKNQLVGAIWKMFRGATAAATEALRGVLRVGTQAEVNAGQLDSVAVTPKKLRWGFSILTGENGGIIFPAWLGGLMILWMRNSGLTIDSTLRSTTFTFPVALTSEMYWCSPFYGGGITGGDSISTARGNSTLTSVAINYTKTGVQYTNIGFIFIVIGR